jgi:hypothetical protein
LKATPIPVRTLLRVAAAAVSAMTLVAAGGTAAAANGIFVPAGHASSQTSGSRAPDPDPTPTTEPTSLPPPPDTSTNQPPPPDVNIDDRDDYSITNITNLRSEGDTYNNTYWYTGADGLTYSGTGLSCGDFTTLDDAQRVLNDLGAWAYLLDSDFDGIACEVECGEFIRNAGYDLGIRYNRGGQVDVWPTGAIDTGLAA